ncbi:hypothetical protein JHK84_047552 [Glycine max]|uniref:Uncharacterized protein n=1 Tax=Glycine max TaxID=3847 RepID=A0A0R0FDC1_SOYBN|nr:hypothetical protein JHK86_047527 [Glycine max]KAG4943475.1 hypothetical protein JHK85_048121 [Glycine max]KAG5102583.1 hypothetical protein JHK84_047552 [Glycine max]
MICRSIIFSFEEVTLKFISAEVTLKFISAVFGVFLSDNKNVLDETTTMKLFERQQIQLIFSIFVSPFHHFLLLLFLKKSKSVISPIPSGWESSSHATRSAPQDLSNEALVHQ